MINKILRLYYHFYRAYINNIIIFFISLKKHLIHLRLIVSTFEKINIYLSLRKFFFNYIFI